MIKGIGIDVLDNSRIKFLHEKYDDSFAKKILSPQELVEYSDTQSKINYLAKHFASKEAFSKAIGTGLFRQGVYPSMISVSHDKLGKPVFALNLSLSKIMTKRNITSSNLSISDIDSITTAMVILE